MNYAFGSLPTLPPKTPVHPDQKEPNIPGIDNPQRTEPADQSR